jgi:hypothetical protein
MPEAREEFAKERELASRRVQTVNSSDDERTPIQAVCAP